MDNLAEHTVNGLPHWLTAGPVPQLRESKETEQLRISQYEIVLPRVLEYICEGKTLATAIRELPIPIHTGAFMRWLKKRPKEYELYRESKEVRTEVWAGKVIEHATCENEDGSIKMEDVSRSRLIVDAYKWLMGSDNNKDYGDKKTINVNETISIRAALEEARARVEMIADIIDVTPTELLAEEN